jgi:hypothetical protein
MQSQFHNLPTFLEEGYDGTLGADSAGDLYDSRIVMEKDGSDFKATDVSCNLNARTLKMDIASAYGDDRIRRYAREVTLIKGEGVMIKDSYDGELDAVLSLMTYEKPEVISNNASKSSKSIKLGNLGILDIHGADDVMIESIPITDPRLSIAWKHEVYRILVRTEGEVLITLV